MMKWYYKIAGGHTHVRVFMSGAKCGDLVFRNEEFNALNPTDRNHIGLVEIEFIEEK